MRATPIPLVILAGLSGCGRAAPDRTASPSIDTADELISRHLEAIGGLDAWWSIHSLTAQGLYHEGKTKERHRLDRKRPNRIRITTRYDPETGELGYAEGYDGAAWEYRAGVPIRVTGTPALALERAAAFDPPFINYAAKGDRVELVGRTRLLERDLYQLRITGIDDRVSDAYFDVESLMHVMSRAVVPHHGEGAPVDIVNVRGDFRRVGGVLLAHRGVERAVPSGEQLSSLTWDRIEVNAEVPDGWFSPPLSAAAAQYQKFRGAALAVELTELGALYSAYIELDGGEIERRRESELNTLGYELLSHERFAAAVAVFQLALARYPRSANLHDSLGEAYMLSSDVARAIESYRRSVELDPGNRHGAAMLEELLRR